MICEVTTVQVTNSNIKSKHPWAGLIFYEKPSVPKTCDVDSKFVCLHIKVMWKKSHVLRHKSLSTFWVGASICPQGKVGGLPPCRCSLVFTTFIVRLHHLHMKRIKQHFSSTTNTLWLSGTSRTEKILAVTLIAGSQSKVTKSADWRGNLLTAKYTTNKL